MSTTSERQHPMETPVAESSQEMATPQKNKTNRDVITVLKNGKLQEGMFNSEEAIETEMPAKEKVEHPAQTSHITLAY